ncbi:hypothetical protein BLNAU_9380 [Blattamonas nauphoetae]|uniref:Uncharacterized protein n=1 Tax=Blattamonas nauphoetae TaxID=2049346 RepID=A0ABQ9XW34_9EUKA|nr:hypothetical protein BLNAU_9380 [Blattamonas nauphoetae]
MFLFRSISIERTIRPQFENPDPFRSITGSIRPRSTTTPASFQTEYDIRRFLTTTRPSQSRSNDDGNNNPDRSSNQLPQTLSRLSPSPLRTTTPPSTLPSPPAQSTNTHQPT